MMARMSAVIIRNISLNIRHQGSEALLSKHRRHYGNTDNGRELRCGI